MSAVDRNHRDKPPRGAVGRSLALRTTTNTLWCDTTITPDGCVVVIEDGGASRVSGTYVPADIDFTAESVHQILCTIGRNE